MFRIPGQRKISVYFIIIFSYFPGLASAPVVGGQVRKFHTGDKNSVAKKKRPVRALGVLYGSNCS